jgi:glutaminyl-tRNA synthetase
MAVLRPLKVVIENYPEGQVEHVEAVNNPEDAAAGTRAVPFSREIYVERDDFREVAPRKFHRLSPGAEVRLRWAYVIKCTSVVKDERGEVVELRCAYDAETGRNGVTSDGRKVRGTIHWVSAPHALDAEVRLYDRLFSTQDPENAPGGRDFAANLNSASLEVVEAAKVEPSVADAPAGTRYQFERVGYFCKDADSLPGRPVFNRTVGLRDTWAKIEKRDE